ncbi:hypothetical protein ACJX0J_011078, partial [Zea mays]
EKLLERKFDPSIAAFLIWFWVFDHFLMLFSSAATSVFGSSQLAKVATIVDSNRTNDVVGKPFLSDRRCAVTGIMHQSSDDKSQLTTSQINTHRSTRIYGDTPTANFIKKRKEKWFASCHKLEYPTLFCCCCCFPILYTYNNADLQELDVEASAITGGQGGAAAAAGGALKARSKGIYEDAAISVNFIHFWSLSNIFFAGAAFLFFCLFSHILSEYEPSDYATKTAVESTTLENLA